MFDEMPMRDKVSSTTLIDEYSGCFSTRRFTSFESNPKRSSVSSKAMFASFVESHCFLEAFVLFETLRVEKLGLDNSWWQVCSQLVLN